MLVQETIRRLKGRIEPAIFCLDSIGLVGEQLQKEGIEVVSFGRRPGRDYRLAWRMARAIRLRGIEVLHCHQYTPFFYGALAKLFHRVHAKPQASHCPKLILTEHGRHYPDLVSPLRRAVNRLFLDPLADAVTAVSRFSARSLTNIDGFAGHRIEIIQNGIDLSRFEKKQDRSRLRERLGLEPRRRYIANVGRLHPDKDQATLLHAFQDVAAGCSDVDLLIVGEGPLCQELDELACKLRIESRVHFLGVRHDVPDILQAVDLFALTSVTEAASLTLLEAMAAKLPVVVTNVGGNPEMVRDGVEGILVPRGQSSAIAAAILQLLANPAKARAMGQAGLERVGEHYRIESAIERYYSLYARLTLTSIPLPEEEGGEGRA